MSNIGQWPLAVKLWGVFAALTLFVFGLLAVLLPWMLKDFFTDQLYDILVDSQTNVHIVNKPLESVPVALTPVYAQPAAVTEAGGESGLRREPGNGTTDATGPETLEQEQELPELPRMTIRFSPKNDNGERVLIESRAALPGKKAGAAAPAEPQPGAPMVRHFVIGSQIGNALAAGDKAARPPDPFVLAIEEKALAQVEPVEKYKLNINNESMFYVIKKELVEGKPSYIVSYTWSNYRNGLVKSMFGRLMLLMVGLLLISMLPCMALARYLTRPLVQIERHVGRLAQRDWHEPLETNRKDEIGRLAGAIESMRQRLVRQDKAQQFFLQNISHELKTPVMVIRSYAQSIQDGIFPKGSLQGSLNVVMKESERLESRIRDLLLLAKLNYLSTRENKADRFQVKPALEETIERLRYRRPELEWDLRVADEARLNGDREQWRVAFENVLDNQLRYARSVIRVAALQDGGAATAPVIRISNDGPPLEEGVADCLFEPFRKGKTGQFGLGLAIVRQIAGNHEMSVRACNEENEVAFYFEPNLRGKDG